MDEATRTGGQAVGNGKRGPEEIRADIEQTREELGDTVEALAAKTDVKAQAKAKVQRDEGARPRGGRVEGRGRQGAPARLHGDVGAARASRSPAPACAASAPCRSPAASTPTRRLRTDPQARSSLVGAVAAGLLLVSLLRSR